ncbi:MAG: hypothetical protein AAGL49_08940, partial [Pseudomonadota bacterium]
RNIENAAALTQLRQAVDAIDARSARAEAASKAAVAAVEDTLRSLETRLEETETDRADFTDKTEARLRALGDELKRGDDQIAELDKAIDEMSAHLEAAEKRSADGVNKVSDYVSRLSEKLEEAEQRIDGASDIARSAVHEALGDVDKKISEANVETDEKLSPVKLTMSHLAERLGEIEQRAAEKEAAWRDAQDRAPDPETFETPESSELEAASIVEPDAVHEFDIDAIEEGVEAEEADEATARHDAAEETPFVVLDDLEPEAVEASFAAELGAISEAEAPGEQEAAEPALEDPAKAEESDLFWDEPFEEEATAEVDFSLDEEAAHDASEQAFPDRDLGLGDLIDRRADEDADAFDDVVLDNAAEEERQDGQDGEVVAFDAHIEDVEEDFDPFEEPIEDRLEGDPETGEPKPGEEEVSYLEAARRAARAAAEASGRGDPLKALRPRDELDQDAPRRVSNGRTVYLLCALIAFAVLALGGRFLLQAPPQPGETANGGLLDSLSGLSPFGGGEEAPAATIEIPAPADPTPAEADQIVPMEQPALGPEPAPAATGDDQAAAALGIETAEPAALEGAQAPAPSTDPAADEQAAIDQAATDDDADPETLYQSALAALEGLGQEANVEAGVDLLKRAAYQSHPPAQFRLGQLYETGRGASKDAAAARRWYERAAFSGNRNSMHNLAVLYARGEGGPQDY